MKALKDFKEISQRVIRPRRDTNASPREELPETDVRRELDESAHRAWREVGRRALRFLPLLVTDTVAAFATLVVALVPLGGAFESIGAFLAWHLPIIVPALVLQPLVLYAVGAYGDGTDRQSLQRVPRGVYGAAALTGVQALLVGGSLTLGPLTAVMLLYAVFAPMSILAGRAAARKVLERAHDSGWGLRRLVAIGDPRQVTQFAKDGRFPLAADTTIVGVLPQTALDPRRNGGPGELERVLSETNADGVLVASKLPVQSFRSVVHRCFEVGASVTVIPQTAQQLNGTRVELALTSAGSLMQITPKGLKVPQLLMKRVIDLSATVVGGILISPLILLVAVAIKLDSRGPVLFRQIRAGVGGRPFRMYKFRTMVENADELKEELQHLNESGDPRLFKIRNDPRITRVGKLLRKTSLDELPQLINVLRGQMSLVGPRPFFPGDLDDYEDHHFERLHVLPGITGLWQVSGRSDVVDFEEVVRLDSEYIRNWSIMMDLSIMARTLPAAFGRENGAY